MTNNRDEEWISSFKRLGTWWRKSDDGMVTGQEGPSCGEESALCIDCVGEHRNVHM